MLLIITIINNALLSYYFRHVKTPTKVPPARPTPPKPAPKPAPKPRPGPKPDVSCYAFSYLTFAGYRSFPSVVYVLRNIVRYGNSQSLIYRLRYQF